MGSDLSAVSAWGAVEASHRAVARASHNQARDSSLTSRHALASFGSVFPGGKEQLFVRRFVGLGLLLFVFFLPLHFHFSPIAQLGKDCGCAQGTRSLLAPAETAPASSPQLQSDFFTPEFGSVWIQLDPQPQDVRAPPTVSFL